MGIVIQLSPIFAEPEDQQTADGSQQQRKGEISPKTDGTVDAGGSYQQREKNIQQRAHREPPRGRVGWGPGGPSSVFDACGESQDFLPDLLLDFLASARGASSSSPSSFFPVISETYSLPSLNFSAK